VSALGSTFIMQDNASVYGNTGNGASESISNISTATFTMQDNSTVHSNSSSGVTVVISAFTMQDNASVYGNSASGVYITGAFTMQDNASVHGNSTHGNSDVFGGGVRIGGGTFTMQDNASVHGNSAHGDSDVFGGGVSVLDWGTFTMQDNASVHGNSTHGNSDVFGGGVSVRSRLDFGIFTKTGNSIITGWGDDTVNGNVVRDSSGAVVNNMGHAIFIGTDDIWWWRSEVVKRQESTAGAGMDLRFDGTTDPPTYSGAWEF
jgi:NDP-sugar pyrophosphorylase family protein